MSKDPGIPPDKVEIGGHRSYLVYGGYRYLKLSLLVYVLSIAAYIVDDPPQGPSGNTWLGYTLGTVGALLIVWLAWLGVRKRRYHRGRGAMQGWLSAHVHLGLTLLVVATLHTGFQFGANVHTLAYVLMCLVIASGMYGVLAYALLPDRITGNRRDTGFRDMVAEVARLDETALAIADRIDPETHTVLLRSVAKVRLGGSAWEQLSGRYRQAGELDALQRFIASKKAPAVGGAPLTERRATATISFVADRMFDMGGERRGESLQQLLQTIAERKALVARINRDITLRARLSAWLYLHVPMTLGLLAALAVHILSSFYYW